MSYPPKGRADHFLLGDWNAICFECGRKFKASEMKKHWQGYYTCERCWEPRHPQDFVRGVPEKQAPPWVQPEPADTFVTDFCDLEGISCIADFAVADCSICDLQPPGFDITDEDVMLETDEEETILTNSNQGIFP